MLSTPNTYAMPGFTQNAGGGYPPAGPANLAYGGPSMVFPQVPGSNGYADFTSPISVYGNNVYLGGGGFPTVAQPIQLPAFPGYAPVQQNNTDVNNIMNVLINVLNQVQTQGAVQQQQTTQQSGGDNSMFLLLALLLGDKGGIGGSSGGGRRGGGRVYEEPAPAPATPATPKPRITTDSVTTTGTTTGGRVWGDPHFIDFEGGGKYDVMGEVGKTYNILSDSNIQFNAKFGPYNGQNDATVITEAGFKLGRPETGITEVKFAPGGKAPIVNGNELKKGEKLTFDTGLNSEDGRPVAGSVEWDGKTMTINSGEYITKLTDQGQNLDQDVTITNLGVRSDGVDPHGLLGQNADGQVDNGKTGKGAQGEGAIEGVYTDYEVQDILGDGFKYNKFGSAAERDAQFGYLAGEAAKGS